MNNLSRRAAAMLFGQTSGLPLVVIFLVVILLVRPVYAADVSFSFPTDHPVGDVFIFSVLGDPWKEPSVHKKAQGTLTIPNSKGVVVGFNDDQEKAFIQFAGQNTATVCGLDFQRCELTDKGAYFLRNFKKLAMLNLRDCDITNKGLENILASPDIVHLDIAHTRVDRAGLSTVGKLTKLKVLYANNVVLGDRKLTELDNCKNLRDLHLSATRLGDQSVESLSNHPSIETLYLNGNKKITDSGLATLKNLTNIRELNLTETGVSPASIKTLATMKKLRILKISFATWKGQSLRLLIKSLPCCTVVDGLGGSSNTSTFFAPLH